MSKSIKKILCLGIVSFLLYVFFKLYLKIRTAVNLSSSLPEYLKNIYEEEMEVNVRIALRNITVTVKAGKEILQKSRMVEKTVEDYLVDFYPELNLKFLDIKLEEKALAEEV
jgi:hypothetical protein